MDKCILIIAFTCSTVFGAGMPGFSFFFGEMINGLGDTTSGDFSMFKDSAKLFLIVGGATAVVAWLQFTLWAVFAHRIGHKTRMIYFAKTLEMDAAFYD